MSRGAGQGGVEQGLELVEFLGCLTHGATFSTVWYITGDSVSAAPISTSALAMALVLPAPSA